MEAEFLWSFSSPLSPLSASFSWDIRLFKKKKRTSQVWFLKAAFLLFLLLEIPIRLFHPHVAAAELALLFNLQLSADATLGALNIFLAFFKKPNSLTLRITEFSWKKNGFQIPSIYVSWQDGKDE